MTYAEIKTMFTGILNRRDITPTQITTFINLGIQYVQRKLRVPPMEALLEFTATGTKNVPVPGDFLEIIAIYVDDTTNGQSTLEKRDLGTVLRAASQAGTPRYYCRTGLNFVIGPVPAEGTDIYVSYYQDAVALEEDTDTNWMTDAMPSVVVYSALRYAADHFLDDRKKLFEATLLEDMSDVQEMANRDELVGGTMTALYPDQTEVN